jgi:hypothetical protein
MSFETIETYYDSARGLIISRKRAFQVLTEHHCEDFDDFLREVGDRKEYSATKVLQWLGY